MHITTAAAVHFVRLEKCGIMREMAWMEAKDE
jgi:hypothetical protein